MTPSKPKSDKEISEEEVARMTAAAEEAARHFDAERWTKERKERQAKERRKRSSKVLLEESLTEFPEVPSVSSSGVLLRYKAAQAAALASQGHSLAAPSETPSQPPHEPEVTQVSLGSLPPLKKQK